VDRASGKTADRPDFEKMFEDASKRKFDLVLFWALDRFSREGVTETLNHLQRLSASAWAGARTRRLMSIPAGHSTTL
jgi:DNA invertase Pin-like site-specific DNA recombinase